MTNLESTATLSSTSSPSYSNYANLLTPSHRWWLALSHQLHIRCNNCYWQFVLHRYCSFWYEIPSIMVSYFCGWPVCMYLTKDLWNVLIVMIYKLGTVLNPQGPVVVRFKLKTIDGNFNRTYHQRPLLILSVANQPQGQKKWQYTIAQKLTFRSHSQFQISYLNVSSTFLWSK